MRLSPTDPSRHLEKAGILPVLSGPNTSPIKNWMKVPRPIRNALYIGVVVVSTYDPLFHNNAALEDREDLSRFYFPPTPADRALDAKLLKPALINAWTTYLKELGASQEDVILMQRQDLYYRIVSTDTREYLGWYAGKRSLYLSSQYVSGLADSLRAHGVPDTNIIEATALLSFPTAAHELEHARTAEKYFKRFGYHIPPCRENETLSIYKEARSILELWPRIEALRSVLGSDILHDQIVQDATRLTDTPELILLSTLGRWSSPSVLSAPNPLSTSNSDYASFKAELSRMDTLWSKQLARRSSLEKTLAADTTAYMRAQAELELAVMKSREYCEGALACGRAWKTLIDLVDGEKKFRDAQTFFLEEFSRIRADGQSIKQSQGERLRTMQASLSQISAEHLLTGAIARFDNDVRKKGEKPVYPFLYIAATYESLPPQTQVKFFGQLRDAAQVVIKRAESENATNIQWSGEDLRLYIEATKIAAVPPADFAQRGIDGAYEGYLNSARSKFLAGNAVEAVMDLYAARFCALALEELGEKRSFNEEVKAKVKISSFTLPGYASFHLVDPDPGRSIDSSVFTIDEVLRKIHKIVVLKQFSTAEK